MLYEISYTVSTSNNELICANNLLIVRISLVAAILIINCNPKLYVVAKNIEANAFSLILNGIYRFRNFWTAIMDSGKEKAVDGVRLITSSTALLLTSHLTPEYL